MNKAVVSEREVSCWKTSGQTIWLWCLGQNGCAWLIDGIGPKLSACKGGNDKSREGFSSENTDDLERAGVRTIIAEAFTMRCHDNARLGWPISRSLKV